MSATTEDKSQRWEGAGSNKAKQDFSIMSSRNQKATALVVGLFIISAALCTFGALVKPETRIKGTIAGHKIDIPAWLQTEPEYDGKLKNVKVDQGWGWARFLFFLIACGPIGLAIALIGERQSELPAERQEYEDDQNEKKQIRKVQTAYKVSLTAKYLQNKGEATLAIQEEKLEMQVDAYREANGIYAPEPVQVPQLPPEPPVLRQPAGDAGVFAGMKTPAEYAAEIEAARQAAIDKLPKDGDAADPKVGDEVPDDRKSMFQQRGTKIMRSLAALRMSILSAAPTGAGKTHTLYKWLGDLQALFPDNECYVIAHKRDSFLGLLEQGRVKVFDSFSPEKSLVFLDEVYAEMGRRLDEPEHERKKFEKMPIRLILDDWFATFDVLKKAYPELWQNVSIKLGAIITKGREANVCVYIATQSFNLVSLGIQDSNIRGNLAITCQGLVTEKVDEYGEIVEQGNYESIQLLIDNKFVVSSKADRDQLNAEIEELIALSRLHKVPAMFAAVGRNTLALAPYYEKPIAGDNSGSTNVAVIDRNSGDDGGDNKVDLLAEFNREIAKRQAENPDFDETLQTPYYSEIDDSDAWDGVDSCNDASNAGNEEPSNEPSNEPGWETLNWYKWLPTKAEVMAIIDSLESHHNFAYLVKNRLKKTEAIYNRKAKGAIVQLLLDLNRDDLIARFEITPNQFPYLG